ncbi:MAG: tRNA (adenosine(37)-N6)-threonylcarbamoyltransferase complex dimerization subunit type 1 TsaB [Acidithiobacillus sp.]|nr:tRNA (adenosine(37)-N6)-threonylcarbamoyltransferase complex dimerization subunit type 1 TsaB [Acidithiobacillus sp.]
MRYWLALESASEACSVAVAKDGRVFDEFQIAPNRHSELLLPMIHGLLVQAGVALSQLEAIACGVGPGGFTSTRLGVSTAQGLALGLDLPIYPISSLRALAYTERTKTVLAAMDARKGEVYMGVFVPDANGIPRLQGTEQVCPPEQVRWPKVDPCLGLGTGWHHYGTLWPGYDWHGDAYPHARAVLELARYDYESGKPGVTATELEPCYIRPSQAEEGR